MNDKSSPPCPFEPLFGSYLNKNDEFFMKLAYNQALKAWHMGEVPVGAVIEFEGEVIAASHNMVESTQDPTAHAEMLAITQAANKLKDWRLNACTLYVTKEPCPMCSGAAIMSRLKKVVYAVKDPKMGFLGGNLEIHKTNGLNHSLIISDNILNSECVELLKTFFALKRKQEPKNKDSDNYYE